MELFGIRIGKTPEDNKKGLTFVAPTKEDGAIEIDTGNAFSAYGMGFDLDKIPDDENELLLTYRSLALQQEIDEGVQEIINEAIISDDLESTVEIVLESVELSENIKEKIREEFEYILKLLNFKNDGYGLFRKWYVDGRLFFHKVIDKNQAKGIVEVIPIDPMNIKLIREVKGRTQQSQTNDLTIYDIKDTEEYYIYSKKPFDKNNKFQEKKGFRISKDAVTFVPSGIMNANGKMVLSYLYKAIKPYNNLKLLEDSVVIYRVTRAPERRIFYVDVGNLPKGKAEQYLKDVMNRFRNKTVYDVNTGTISNRKKFQSMIEDYWLPRREGGRGTEVSTLPGGEQLGEMTDVEYFKNKLYKAMNVPLSRFQQDSSAFNVGRSTEITRDEIKFNKFISRLRRKFAHLFDDMLKTQLILKKIVTAEEWEELVQDISYTFLEDNYFSELKEIEVMNDRVQSLNNLLQSGSIGKYYSHSYIRRHVLRQSEDDIKEMDKEIAEEVNNKQYNPPEPENEM